jgi:TadE-like protein
VRATKTADRRPRPAASRGKLPPGLPRRGQRGSVTAETAIVLPILVAFALGLVWLVSLGVTAARCTDAAREAARALARDDSRTMAVGLARRSAPEGARISIVATGDVVEVTVSVDAHAPGPLLAALPAVHLSGTAVSALEVAGAAP